MPQPSRRHYISPRRNRMVPVFILCGLLVGVMGSLAVVAFYFFDTPDRPSHFQSAEWFVNYVCLGIEGDPNEADDPEALCGYAKAYDMLADDLRDEVSYASFCSEFELIRQRAGQIQKILEVGFKRGSGGRVSYSYHLHFGRPDMELDELKAFLLDLSMKRGGSGWIMLNYSIQPFLDREMR